MGTLFSQNPREFIPVTNGELDAFLSSAVQLAKKHKISLSDVIAAKDVLESERRNNLSVRDGDIRDEQLAGFGQLIKEGNDILLDIRTSVNEVDDD